MFFRFGCVLAALAVLPLVGCDSGPATGLVSGVVTIDGKPIGGAVVNFYPTDGRASTGTTDANGQYELAFTRQKMGAVLGSHKVTITTEILAEVDYSADDDYANREGDASLGRIKNRERRELLSVEYSDYKRSPLLENVVSGENPINFDLKSK